MDALRSAPPALRLGVVLAALLVVVQIAYPQVPDERTELMTALTILVFLGASLSAAWHRSGPRYALGLAGLAFLCGYAFELLGISTGFPFSPYAYTDLLQPQLLDVPILIPLAWAMMAYPAWRMGEILGTTPAVRALLAAGALTAWDVALDPQMVMIGYWEWPSGGAYAGIPLVNFAGWLLVGLVLFGWWALVARGGRPAGSWRLGDLLGPLLYAWTWIGSTVAHLLFFSGPGVALASFVAMGLFVIPAFARLRRGTGAE